MRKDTVIRWIMLAFYVILLFWMVNFHIVQLFHLKSLVIVVLGTLFLTIAKYNKTLTKANLLEFAKWHSLITGFILTFLLNLTQLTSVDEKNGQLLAIALNFRPLFYSVILYLLLNQINLTKFIHQNIPINNSEEKNQPVIKILSNKSITEDMLLNLKVQFKLTQRELEISQMMISNLNNQEISQKLYISEATAKKHISNIYKKCSISNRDQLRILISTIYSK